MRDTVAAWRNLPPELAADAARQDQDRRWARGERPTAETYLNALPQVAASPDDALLVIYGEVMNRSARGETCDLGEYARRFPQFADRLAGAFAVHGELVAEPVAGDDPGDEPVIPGLSSLTFVCRGGMGAVYRATDNCTGEAVAVKLLADTTASPEAIIRFLQEREVLARLAHPNVVRYVAAGTVGGRPYLVSEWVGGGTLADRAAGRPQPPTWAAATMAAVASAAAHAHDLGVVHRDLKPANVLLTPDGVPKVADFGVARLVRVGEGLSSPGQVIGTIRYMPPEQVEGKHERIGPASDVYAAGAVLYELLTGQPPFPGRDRDDVVDRILSEVPPLPSSVVAGVPAWLDAVCARCLAKRPADRYPSATELATHLAAGS